MTDFIEFKTYEDYLKDNARRAQTVGEFHKRERDALQAHAELKAEYQRTIQDSVVNGKDASVRLDELDAQIADAERQYIRRQGEHAVARATTDTKVKNTDVITAQPAYAAEVRKAHVDPFLTKMEQARDLIAEACRDYREAEREYSSYFADIKEVYVAAHKSKDTPYLFYPNNPFGVSHIQNEAYKIGDTLKKAGVN